MRGNLRLTAIAGSSRRIPSGKARPLNLPAARWRSDYAENPARFSSLVQFQAGPPISLVPAAGDALDRVGDAAIGPLERGDAFHLVGAQHEIEDVEILGDALRLRREWNGRDVLLDQPAQRDLSDGAAALLCN